MSDFKIKALQTLYKQGKLVPFIGAGLSQPFKIPTWPSLIRKLSDKFLLPELRPSVESYLKLKKYWEAMQVIIDLGQRTQFDIQAEVVKILDEEQLAITNVPLEEHNYSDIGKMNFRTYVTTNYDHLIYDFVSGPKHIPLIMKNASISSQELGVDDKKRILHLHGHISDTGSIVLTRTMYDHAYGDEKFTQWFSQLFAGNTFLFVGFSFDDEYIKDIAEKLSNLFHTKHYILMNNPGQSLVAELNEKYGIEIVSYDTTNSTHAKEIRRILNEISSNHPPDTDSNTANDEDVLFIPVPDAATKRKLEENLFCKKIRLENIDDDTVDVSKEFFFYADSYIRLLRKKKFNTRVIESILAICYAKYRDLQVNGFNKHSVSQLFIEEVHSRLATIDYGRINQYLDNSYPQDFENKGFIHLLADDGQKYNVWWGNKRFAKEAEQLGEDTASVIG